MLYSCIFVLLQVSNCRIKTTRYRVETSEKVRPINTKKAELKNKRRNVTIDSKKCGRAENCLGNSPMEEFNCSHISRVFLFIKGQRKHYDSRHYSLHRDRALIIPLSLSLSRMHNGEPFFCTSSQAVAAALTVVGVLATVFCPSSRSKKENHRWLGTLLIFVAYFGQFKSITN